MRQSFFTGASPANDNIDEAATGDLFNEPVSMGVDLGRGDRSTVTVVHPGGTVEFVDEGDPRFQDFLRAALGTR